MTLGNDNGTDGRTDGQSARYQKTRFFGSGLLTLETFLIFHNSRVH